jgi:quercetin dioxygenase-like cupin family protein
MPRVFIPAALALSAANAFAQDAVQTDGDKYKVILENECVRVLDYRDAPGEKTHQHRHPRFVLYALAPFRRSLTLADGKVLVREFKAGDVMWSEAQTHIGENIGQTPTHVVIVEVKSQAGSCTKQ